MQLPVDTEVQYKYVRVNKDGAVVAWEGLDAGALWKEMERSVCLVGNLY